MIKLNRKRLLSFFTMMSVAFSVFQGFTGYAYSAVEDSSVASIQNRDAYYSLSTDNIEEWKLNNTENTQKSLSDSTLTFNNNRGGHATLARYFENPPTLEDNLAEAEFTVEFSGSEGSVSQFDIVGAEIDKTGDPNDNSILRIERNIKDGKMYIYDTNEQTIDITDHTFISGNTYRLKIHTVINFNTRDMDVDVYSVNNSGDTVFRASYRDVKFYDSTMTTIKGLYMRAAKNSTMVLSDAVLYHQGEAKPELTLYDLAKDEKAKDNWTASNDLSVTIENNGDSVTSLTHNKNDAPNNRTATADMFSTSTNTSVNVKYDISMTVDGDGFYNKGDSSNPDNFRETHNSFSILDSAGQDVFRISAGSFKPEAKFKFKINDTDVTSSFTDSLGENGEITLALSVEADIDFSTHKMTVTIKNASNTIYTGDINIAETLTNVAKMESSIHRDSSGIKASNTISNLVVTQDNTFAPVITAQDNLTVEVNKSISAATVTRYDKVDVSVTEGSESIVTAEFSNVYSSVIVTGKSVGTATITVKAYNYNGDEENGSYTKTDEKTITINVIEDHGLPQNTEEPGSLATCDPEKEIIDLNFDDKNIASQYKYFDEYGRTHDDESKTWTSIQDISSGSLGALGGETTNETIPDDHISGNAFYSWLTPDNDTQTGNGYRGSMLELDNALVQRTDKIEVSYDFAFYNIVNDAGNGETAGTPFLISMTSEAEETAGIPYSFNSLAYDEIDSDPSDLSSVSKHLLTFFTGRPKRDSDGVHFTDMTNRLAYYDPRYEEYIDLGIELRKNDYNYFHVDAKIDFVNDIIEFTIKDCSDSNNEPNTITTNIPENASWNGFIIASNKWDQDLTVNESNPDINGQDTEHYAYLDNIKAVKIAEERRHLSNITAPTEHPLPTDAVTLVKNKATNGTWSAEAVKELVTPETAMPIETETPKDGKEIISMNGFTYDIVTAAGAGDKTHIPISSPAPTADGITSYTEFDFYLPKEGSKLTFYLTGTKDGSEVVGNTITISSAGINSWYGNKNYETITAEKLDSGKWYSMQIIYDLNDPTMRVIVTDNAETETKPIADATVNSRGLVGGYYRGVAFNPQSITTGDNGEDKDDTENYVSFPAKEPSMATVYVANLRIYNRATITEYYPEGAEADGNGDVTIDEQSANNERLGYILSDFVRDRVGDNTSDNVYTRYENYPVVPPKNDDGKTFTGWKLIYTNGSDGNAESGTVGENATRIKYAAVYGDLPVDSVKSDLEKGYYYMTFWTDLPIMTPNYNTIQWYVYARENSDTNYTYRMTGDFDLTGIHTQLSGDGNYRIGYVVYNIPETYADVIALPQAHHVPVKTDEPTATELPAGATPSPFATAQPKPSDAPGPDASRPTPDPEATAMPLETPNNAE